MLRKKYLLIISWMHSNIKRRDGTLYALDAILST